jgi:hypothetical protein
MAATDRMRVSGRWLGLLVLASILVGRGLSVALPGSRAGIRDWITAVRTGGAILSHFAWVGGSVVVISLLGAVLWRRTFQASYRLCVLPAGAAIVTLIAISSRSRLGLSETVVLGTSTVLIAVASGLVTLGPIKSRGLGLVLLGTAAAAACTLTARTLGQSAEPWASPAARHLATWGFAFDAASLATATAWLTTRRVRALVPVIGAIVVAAAVLSWGAAVGSTDGATLWQVLSSRMLSEWASYPAPIVDVAARHWLEAYALLLALTATVLPRRTFTLEASLTLVLASRASVDIPLCALFLTLGALIAPFESTD